MNRKLLLHAYEVIDGIPERNFSLQTFFRPGNAYRTPVPPKPDCGTVACAAGWLSMHPDFQLEDFKPDLSNFFWLVYINKTGDQLLPAFEAMAKIFDLDVELAEEIFDSTGRCVPSHKELWKARVRDVLEKGYVDEAHQ